MENEPSLLQLYHERNELRVKLEESENKRRRLALQLLTVEGQCMEEHHWKGKCQAQTHLNNLLARIFRDGGQRQDTIDDDAQATQVADSIVARLNVLWDWVGKCPNCKDFLRET